MVKVLISQLRRDAIEFDDETYTAAADLIERLGNHCDAYVAALQDIALNKDEWHSAQIAVDALGYDPEDGEE
jgi:hypothetical protein